MALSFSGRGSYGLPTETEAKEVGIELSEARDIAMLAEPFYSLGKFCEA